MLDAFNAAPGPPSPISYAPTLIIIAVAFIVPILLSRTSRWLALPVVVGEIMLGIVFGQLFPGLAQDELLIILSEIGFGFLFFIAGTEIDFASLRLPRVPPGTRRSIIKTVTASLPMGAVIYVITLSMAYAASILLERNGLIEANSALFLGVTLAPSSLGIILSVLKERGYARRRFGQIILVSATVADFATVLVLTVLISVIENGGITSNVYLIGIIFLVFLAIYGLMRLLYKQPAIQQLVTRINTPTAPVKLRFAFVIFLVFLALSQALGAKVVLGTFLGGVLVSLLATKEDQDIIHQIESIGYAFFVPMFFVMIGVRFNLAVLLDHWQEAALLVPVLLVIAVAVKFVPALLFRLHGSWRETIAGGMLLTARLSLLVAAAQSGVSLGVFGPPEQAAVVDAAIILLAIFMATLGPLVFNRLMPYPDEEKPPPIVIANAGLLGLEVAEQLRRHGEQVVLVDPDTAHIAQARRLGFEAIEGHVDRPDERVRPYLVAAERFVTTYTEVDINYQICRFVKETYGVPHIVAEVGTPSDLRRFTDMGITATNPTLDRTMMLALLTRSPGSYELMTRTDDNQDAHEVIVRNPYMVGKTLRDLRLPSELLVIAVRRGNDLIVPHGDTRLLLGDYVTVIGPVDEGTRIYQLFSTSQEPVPA